MNYFLGLQAVVFYGHLTAHPQGKAPAMKSCPVCDTDYPDQHKTCPTDGAMLIESHELGVGSLVRGKYRVVRKLGQGGMGVVYLSEHLLLGGQVALKFLATELSKNPQFIKRFRNEARAAFQLRHPNIVEVLDLDQAEDGSLFIAMEYVDGPSLRTVAGGFSSGMPVPLALSIARGVASGLAAAHARGTVHRDIKPENILLTGTAGVDVQAKVLDFGIAAMLDGPSPTSLTRGLMLTPEYASPEQWRGMPAADMDGRTDLYALGGVLYEMLTGQTPFHAHTMEGWMFAHLQENPMPPSTLRPELAEWPGLDAQVMRLLARDRAARHKDAGEVVALLDIDRHARPATPAPVAPAAPRLDGDHPETIVLRSTVRASTMVEPPAPVAAAIVPQGPVPPIAVHAAPVVPLPLSKPKKGFPGWVWGVLGAVAAVLLVVVMVRMSSNHSSPPPVQPVSDSGSGGGTVTPPPQSSTEDSQAEKDKIAAQQAATQQALADAEAAKKKLALQQARAAAAERQKEIEEKAKAEQEQEEDAIVREVGGDPSLLSSERKAKFVANMKTMHCKCPCGMAYLLCYRNDPKCPYRSDNVKTAFLASK
jgi:serine/threonine-protein kinase